MTARGWADRLGITIQRLHQRLAKYPLAIALEPDPRKRRAWGQEGRIALYKYRGHARTVREIMKLAKVSRGTVYNWIKDEKLERVRGPACSKCGEMGHRRKDCPE